MSSDKFKLEIDALMSQVRLRNQSAFSMLYDKTSSRLYGLVLKIIPNEDSAQDVLQESFHKIWANAELFRSDLGSAWSWICQLTRNHAIDHCRKYKKDPASLEDINVEDPSSFDTSAVWPEHFDLGRCLKEIRHEQQNAILHAYVYGLSHSELMEKFDVPLGTMKSWIRRGLKELRVCLEA